jgi:rSAM/selenodomain-associated transferase 2
LDRTSFSFVIPVVDEGEHIAGLLRQLAQQYPGCERVVVEGGSSDDTAAQAAPLCEKLLACEPGRARQMNMGAGEAAGSYIFFLHADSLPTIDAAQLSKLLADEPQWGFCRTRLSGSHPVFRLIEWAMNARSRVTRIGTGDQMLFLRSDVFVKSDGFADIPLMEDVEYCKRLRQLSAPLIVQQPVLTSSRRWESRGVARTVLQMWALRLAYFLGISPQRLWGYYYGR